MSTASSAPQTLTLRRPDDWHVHLRDGAMLEACAAHTARQFARAIIMSMGESWAPMSPFGANAPCCAFV